MLYKIKIYEIELKKKIEFCQTPEWRDSCKHKKKKKVIKGTFQVERLEKKCNIFIGKKKIEKDPEVWI